jgi:hypothetical protein
MLAMVPNPKLGNVIIFFIPKLANPILCIAKAFDSINEISKAANKIVLKVKRSFLFVIELF